MSAKVIAGRYELIEKIGDGGMAVVYKAKCRLLNRFVAVKILKPEFTKDAKFIENFRKESHAAASLTHPNIVAVYDVGREGNINYIVMELIEGQTLSELINAEAPLDYRRVIEITKQIAAGLSVAHKRGIIHRDIKPHNVMMTSDGVAKITDFGIAKAMSSTTIVDSTNDNIMGSVHYFSPEQARGGYIDEKSDIYALGIVMYEMLTGKVPFDGDNPVTVALMHINNEMIPPSKLVTGIPPRLEQIVMKATSKYQTDRYASADDLISELNNIEFVTRIVGDSVYTGIGLTSQPSGMEPAQSNLQSRREEKEEYGKPEKKKKAQWSKKKKIIVTISIVLGVLLIAAGAALATGLIGGPSEVEVPKVTGMSYEGAKILLEASNLKIEKGSEIVSDKFPKGEVAKQNPKAGSTVKEGFVVTVYISKGEGFVTVPNLVGKSEEKALEILSDYELEGNVTTAKSEKPKGEVLEQNPAAGEKVKTGDVVTIVISDGTGKEEATMPYVIGSTLKEAKKSIEAAGLVVGKTSYDYSDTYAKGEVMWQSPDPNVTLPKGTKVDIRVSNGPKPEPEPTT
ncbi:MAG: Stk1 family PASTA domain-containing Ser/Thr kinase [Anaerovoracaceae bacterium]